MLNDPIHSTEEFNLLIVKRPVGGTTRLQYQHCKFLFLDFQNWICHNMLTPMLYLFLCATCTIYFYCIGKKSSVVCVPRKKLITDFVLWRWVIRQFTNHNLRQHFWSQKSLYFSLKVYYLKWHVTLLVCQYYSTHSNPTSKRSSIFIHSSS